MGPVRKCQENDRDSCDLYQSIEMKFTIRTTETCFVVGSKSNLNYIKTEGRQIFKCSKATYSLNFLLQTIQSIIRVIRYGTRPVNPSFVPDAFAEKMQSTSHIRERS